MGSCAESPNVLYIDFAKSCRLFLLFVHISAVQIKSFPVGQLKCRKYLSSSCIAYCFQKFVGPGHSNETTNDTFQEGDVGTCNTTNMHEWGRMLATGTRHEPQT